MTPNCFDCYHVGETLVTSQDGTPIVTLCGQPGMIGSSPIDTCGANRLASAVNAEAIGVCGQQGRFFEPILDLPPIQITREVAHA